MIYSWKNYRKTVGLVISTVLLVVNQLDVQAWAGTYTDSSHGSNGEAGRPAGVNRSSLDKRLKSYATGNCAHCHEQHSSIDGASPSSGSSVNRYFLFDVEQDACLACHKGTPASDISSLFTIGGTPNIITYHGRDRANNIDYIFDFNSRHVAQEDVPNDFGPIMTGANRHAECTDCHEPHTATAIDISDTSVGPTIGATGVFPASRTGNWVTPIWTNVTASQITDRMEQYKICYKCHSNWAGYGTGTNIAREFNDDNESFHNIEGDFNPPSSDIYGNFYIEGEAWAYKMMPRYKGETNNTLRNAQMICSDCHGQSDISAQGIHGSEVAHILKVPNNSPFTTWDEASDVTDNNIWCFNCHDPAFTNSGFSSGGMGGANFHMSASHQENNNVFCMSCHVAVPHGYKNPRMLVCDDETDPIASSDTYIRGTRTGGFLCAEERNWAPSGGWNRNLCHGSQSSPGVTNCHGI